MAQSRSPEFGGQDFQHLVEFFRAVTGGLKDDFTLPVDDVIPGNQLGGEKIVDCPFGIRGQRETQTLLAGKALDLFFRFFPANTKEGEFSGFIFLPDLLLQPGHLGDARGAPGGKEVEKKNMAFQVSNIENFSIQGFHFEGGHRVSHFGEGGIFLYGFLLFRNSGHAAKKKKQN